MADLASVFQQIQFGKETTPGTSVAANKLLTAIGAGRFQGQGDGVMFAPQGSKLQTVAVPSGMRHVVVPFNGVMSYSDLVYLLASAINSTTPASDGTNGKSWSFFLSKAAVDTKQTYTLEIGNSTHAQKATFCQVTGFSLDMNRGSTQVAGQFMGQQLQDDVAITASPTEITPKIIAPANFNVYVEDSQAALATAAAFGRPIKAAFSIDNIVSPLFRMNSADNSYISQIELAPSISLKLTTDADDAGMAFLTNMTAGSTKFVRVRALGDTIAGATASQYSFILDFAGKVVKHPNPVDDNGSALAEWEFSAVYDTTWAKAFQFTVINELAAL